VLARWRHLAIMRRRPPVLLDYLKKARKISISNDLNDIAARAAKLASDQWLTCPHLICSLGNFVQSSLKTFCPHSKSSQPLVELLLGLIQDLQDCLRMLPQGSRLRVSPMRHLQ